MAFNPTLVISYGSKIVILSLTNSANKSDFLEEVKETIEKEFNNDAVHIEFYSNYENLGDGVLCEEIWEFVECSDEDLDNLNNFLEVFGTRELQYLTPKERVEIAKNAYMGQWLHEADFVLEQIGYHIENLPQFIRKNIDLEAIWEEEYRHNYGYHRPSGTIFNADY